MKMFLFQENKTIIILIKIDETNIEANIQIHF